uniref:P-type ATPase C-terminal domain-containing protein n=1 Tax=Dromaius novaehollandiae TaxID=8790 RepID=A0A8C4KR89_DRONO
MEFPELYVIGQRDELFNYRIFGVTLLHGVSTSLASFYIALWAFEDRVGSKVVGDYESFAITVATSSFLSVIVEIVMDIKFWTALSFLVVTTSVLFFCLFSFLTQSINAFKIAPAVFCFPGKMPQGSLQQGLAWEVATALMYPISLQKIRLKTKREPEPSVELRAHIRRGSFCRRSSYAFSHHEGYAGLITRGDSLRAKESVYCPVGLFLKKHNKTKKL